MKRLSVHASGAQAMAVALPTLCFLTTAIAAFSCAERACAQGALAYTFETGLQGFHANSGGTTVAEDTIGATEGSAQSMKFSVVALQTFAGALSEGAELTPLMADPPGLDFVTFDLTITTQFPSEGFARIGVSLFGWSQPDYPGGQLQGLQVNFDVSDEVAVQPLPVGTHQIRIDLHEALHPLTFEAATFREIFGTVGSGPNDLLPTGFEIYLSKSNTAPWTGYIDNIRLGVNPNANFNHDAIVDGADLAIWRTAFGVNGNANGDADFDGDSDGSDFLIWQDQFGAPGSIAAIPEPTSLFLAVLTAFACARFQATPRSHQLF